MRPLAQLKVYSLILVASLALPALGHADSFTLKAEAFETISFGRVSPTTYRFDDGVLIAEVKESASALLHAFTAVRSISKISFEWKRSGDLKVKDSRHEARKSGDDAWLRVGLILHGSAPTVPFFAPAWIKRTRDVLKLPSDQMVYLTVASQHPPGQSWESPYTSSIKSISVPSEKLGGEWKRVEYTFAEPQQVVGLWLMADGDDTKSTFESRLRSLSFE